RDEVGDKEAALREGKKWREYALIIDKLDKDVVFHIVFRWLVWEPVGEEVYEFIEKLGLEWDDLEVWYGCDFNAFLLFNDGEYVATVIKPNEEEET
ncbi:MAG: hypothetical protein N3A69_17795, partial [Leptospiraceae bacterium]|nr:hypothetical protein [Leptospiraceae bacterium]